MIVLYKPSSEDFQEQIKRSRMENIHNMKIYSVR